MHPEWGSEENSIIGEEAGGLLGEGKGSYELFLFLAQSVKVEIKSLRFRYT